MSKPLVMLSALVAAGALAIAGGLYFGPDYSSINSVRFDQGKSPTQLFMPPATDKESTIVRHPNTDGSAVDDVVMRDGTSKRMVYDTRMVLRQISAYYKPAKGLDQGALMYTKEHNADGHLIAERHLRLDGSLEMDGQSLSDSTYERRLYFPGKSATPDGLVVSSLRTFDKVWKPITQVDYRPDRTRDTFQLWTKDTQYLTAYAADGMTALWTEKVKGTDYGRSDYYPGGRSVRLETSNAYDGTTFQWYREDATSSLKVAFVNTKHVVYTIMSASGKPVLSQDWAPNYYEKADAKGEYPRYLESITHYDADGKLAVRYEYDNKGVMTAAIKYLGAGIYDPRVVYQLDADGYTKKITTFKDSYQSDGGVDVTRDKATRFVEDPAAKVIPSFDLPPLKAGLKFWGDPPNYGPY